MEAIAQYVVNPLHEDDPNHSIDLHVWTWDGDEWDCIASETFWATPGHTSRHAANLTLTELHETYLLPIVRSGEWEKSGYGVYEAPCERTA